MTLQEAVMGGHRRVRLPYWADPHDYLLLDILLDEMASPLCGPWGRLYAPLQLELGGMDRPQTVLLTWDASRDWEPYTGPPAPDEGPVKDERGRQPWGDA